MRRAGSHRMLLVRIAGEPTQATLWGPIGCAQTVGIQGSVIIFTGEGWCKSKCTTVQVKHEGSGPQQNINYKNGITQRAKCEALQRCRVRSINQWMASSIRYSFTITTTTTVRVIICESVQPFDRPCAPLRLQSREMRPREGVQGYSVLYSHTLSNILTGRSGDRTHTRIHMWSCNEQWAQTQCLAQDLVF